MISKMARYLLRVNAHRESIREGKHHEANRKIGAGARGDVMSEEVVALALVALIAIGQLLKTKDDPDEWLLDTYAKCLATVQLKDVVLEPR